MKTKLITGILLSISVLVLSSLLLTSCDSDDDEIMDSMIPETSDFLTNISSAPGIEFKFEGKITDDNGIASVNIQLKCPQTSPTISHKVLIRG